MNKRPTGSTCSCVTYKNEKLYTLKRALVEIKKRHLSVGSANE